ncbi:MAG TPA: ROK family transcriptional regulator [Acidimicrobiales bacterium]|nr:ROK family transcriptional regulator [Acidimicrobiales bacterium]
MSAEDLTPQAAQRRRHERSVFHEIRRNGPISRSQLADRTGLSAQAMGTIVRSLLDMGLIEECPMARREGPGAPATGIQLRPDGAFAFGFGLERDSLSGALVDLSGKSLWQYKRPVEPGERPADTLDSIAAAVRSVLRSPRLRQVRGRTRGLGVAAPGPINLADGTIVGPPEFPGWEKVPVVSWLEAATSLPVLVDNAATAAALGVEWQMLPAHGSFLYCYWGLGIGGGLVIGGEAYRGSTGNVAELGHVVVNENGRPCACGGRGCLEAESSAAAVLRDARQHGQFPNIEAVANAAASIPAVRQLLEKAAHQMAAALVSAVNLTDVPEVIVGGAHFAAVEEIFLPILRSVIEGQVLRRRVAPVTLRTAPVGEEANALGVAALVLHEQLPHNSSTGTHAARDPRSVHADGQAREGRRPPSAKPLQDPPPNEFAGTGGRR